MGAFYNSICIPGDERRRARESLLRWLGMRGFELSDRPVLFDLDAETERCAFLVWNPRWTLLFFSNYEEERRLIRELQTWSDSFLYVWVQDSDVWGYDAFNPDGYVGSFNSDPRTYRSFADDPTGEDRPEVDVQAFCQRFGIDGSSAELQAIHRGRAIFKEDVCGDLCRLIGAAPALTSYDDLERGTFKPSDDWRLERMLFVHRDASALEQDLIDLHAVDLGGRRGDKGSAEGTAQIEIPPEVLAEMGRRRQRTRLTVRLLRPLSWLARGWRRVYEAPALFLKRRRADGARAGDSPARATATAAPEAGASFARQESSAMIEVRHLINERHRCRIRLAVGGEARSGSSKPASVFAFQIGPTSVTCTARRRSRIEEALQRPSRSKILRDDKYLIGDLKARHIVFQLPPYYLAGTPGPSYLGLHVVQTDWAHYVFLYRFPRRILTEVERAIRATVESFRILS